ncbi:MAG: conjugal transfer protein TraF [Fibrobacter sp.]|nr:conjugal transfer protein TraF [Fibrobacter sp.]
MRYFISSIILFAAVATFAAKAPTHHSLRAESMGNAHVAVVDDKDAIYYNYAGLSQINRLGNFEKRPEQGYYPRNYIDARISVGGAGPFETYFSTYDLAKDLQDMYNNARDAAVANGLTTNAVLMDSLSSHPELVHKINSYDHKYLSMKLKLDAELAFHGFGGAIWFDGTINPYLDGGVILPFLVVDTLVIDGVVQAGGGFSITDNISVGAGLKAAKREKVRMITVDVMNYNAVKDTLEDRYHDITDDVFNGSTISFGMDLGVLYQLTREVRLGASLNDIYFKELAGDKITPNFSVGVNYSPKFFNRNTAYARKFNVAFDYANAFFSERNYKPFSHMNFGMEVEQTLLAWPGLNNEIRALSLRLSGGFKGGYPSAGVGLELLRFITLEFATWSEELGYYTGQDEERIYMVQASLGF